MKKSILRFKNTPSPVHTLLTILAGGLIVGLSSHSIPGFIAGAITTEIGNLMKFSTNMIGLPATNLTKEPYQLIHIMPYHQEYAIVLPKHQWQRSHGYFSTTFDSSSVNNAEVLAFAKTPEIATQWAKEEKTSKPLVYTATEMQESQYLEVNKTIKKAFNNKNIIHVEQIPIDSWRSTNLNTEQNPQWVACRRVQTINPTPIWEFFPTKEPPFFSRKLLETTLNKKNLYDLLDLPELTPTYIDPKSDIKAAYKKQHPEFYLRTQEHKQSPLPSQTKSHPQISPQPPTTPRKPKAPTQHRSR